MLTNNATSRPSRLRAADIVAALPWLAVVAAVLIRLVAVLRADFPLGDGGLFYCMVEDLRRNHYVLPLTTSFNQAGIPFAYPPLGLYLAAAIADLTGAPLLDVFRLLPTALSLLVIAAYGPLARSLLGPGPRFAYAVAAFALLPFSAFWLVMGGGLTRALGLLFAVLALWQGHRFLVSGRWLHGAAAGALLALTAGSHPSMALSAGGSMICLTLSQRPRLRSLGRAAVAGLVAILLSAPWWATVIARHGLPTLLGASGTSLPLTYGLMRFAILAWTNEPAFPVLGGLAVLGILVCLREQRLLLPAWLALLFALDPRHALTTATVPLGMLAAMGIVDALLPLLASRGSAQQPAGAPLPASRVIVFVLAVALEFGAASAATSLNGIKTLTGEQRTAMAWISQSTPADARFLLISPGEGGIHWTNDWFPTLTGRISVATYQRYEWLGKDAFLKRWPQSELAQRCATADGACLEAVRRSQQLGFAYVYIAKPRPEDTGDATGPLRRSLAHDAAYEMLYDGPGAQVYHLLKPSQP
ncbi:MAG: hypothetical protein ACUVX9_17085 [Anaerolineae bacterium]